MKKIVASLGLLALGATGLPAINYGDLGVDAASKRWNASLALRGFFDDNYNTRADGPDKRSSPGFVVTPGASFNLPGSRTHFSSLLNYSMIYYQDREINKVDQNIELGMKLNHKFTERYTLRAEDLFTYSSEPELIDLTGTVTVPIRGDSDGMRNLAPIEFDLQLTRLFSVVLGYQNLWYNYLDTGVGSYSALLDRFEQDFRFDARWQLRPTTVGLIGYTFGLVNYTSSDPLSVTPSPVPGAPPEELTSDTRNSISHNLYTGFEHSFTTALKLEVRVGVNYYDYAEANSSSLSPSFNLALNYLYLPGSSMRFGINQARNATDNVGSGTSAETIALDQDTTTVYASLHHRITAKLTGGVNLLLQHSVYNGGLTLDGQADDYVTASLSLIYRFNRNWSCDIEYSHYEFISDDATRSYSRNRIAAGVRVLY